MRMWQEAPEWDDDVLSLGWRVALWFWAENRVFRSLGVNPVTADLGGGALDALIWQTKAKGRRDR